MLGGGGLFIGPSPPVLPSICILILYKSAACSMGLSEMDAQVYNTLGRRYGNEGNIIPRSHNPPPIPQRYGQKVAAAAGSMSRHRSLPRTNVVMVRFAGPRAAKRLPSRAVD